MGSLILGVLVFIAALALMFIPVHASVKRQKNLGSSIAIMVGVGIAALGAYSYNDGGNCQYIRTITGAENSTCKVGWYFKGWGTSTQWPWNITVSHTDVTNTGGTSVNTPYKVRMSDNWTGHITQVTRFEIPQDEVQFIEMAKIYKTPSSLVGKALLPSIKASLDSVANLYSMEDYYVGGKRDQFKSEFEDAISKGRAQVKQVSIYKRNGVQEIDVAPNDNPDAADTSNTGDKRIQSFIMQKVLGSDGLEIRRVHPFQQYGITVSSAILENLDPDDRFEDQIQDRKDAASRRIIAQEERKEQEEQRLLAIQTGETTIAVRQAEAKTEQIQLTTEAETQKKLALIKADRVRSEARIAKETAQIDFERAQIDAQSVRVTAEAEAHARKVLILADGALKVKVDAYVRGVEAIADAWSKRQVPDITITNGEGQGGASSSADEFQQVMQMIGINMAKQLNLNLATDVVK